MAPWAAAEEARREALAELRRAGRAGLELARREAVRPVPATVLSR
jgi:hypothetical protein